MRINKKLKNSKNQKLQKGWLLLIILSVAAVLRLWNLGNIPPHLTPDEAALGYNAYSILKTGRDEYGKVLPIIFKSFGDYKPGLYVYATVPSVAIFGLNEWSVRLPSAIAGILSVYLIYLITWELFGYGLRVTGLNTKHTTRNWLTLPIISAFVASASPWLIYFSRGAWEVNLSLALTLAGIYFFLKSLHTSHFILHASFAFALTLLTYQGAKLATGIVVALLLVIYWQDFWQIKGKYLIGAFMVGFIISVPIVLSVFRGQTGRLEVFSVFSYPRPQEYLQKFLDQGEEKVGSLSYYLFHSEALNFLRGIMGRYFNHFSGRFLFFEGDFSNPRHSAPNSGMLLLSDLITLLLGFVLILKSYNLKPKSYLFILLWLILAPLPSVLSRDQVHAVRAFNLAIPLIIISAFGFSYLFSKAYYLLLATCYLFAFIYFVDSYFVHLPKHNSKLWEYGYKQVVEAVTPIQKNYSKIKVQQSFAQPYIYFLFYQKYDPAKYQKTAQLAVADSVKDVGYVLKLDNIEFVPIDWSINRGERGTLFIADPVRIPPEDSRDENLFKVISEIKYLNGGDIAFRIIEVK